MKKLLYTLITTVLFTATALSQGEQRYANGTATDQDGNTFEWINYGTQDWAIENSEVVTYRDGTPIPQVTDDSEWFSLTTGAWCYYDNDSSNSKLYNAYAIVGKHDDDPNTPNKEFAPEGWNIPTNENWASLLSSIGMEYSFNSLTNGEWSDGNEGSKLSGSENLWFNNPNNCSGGLEGVDGALVNDPGFNSSGFNWTPDGYRSGAWSGVNPSFCLINEWGFLWSKTSYNSYYYSLNVTHNRTGLAMSNGINTYGRSVRFVRGASSVGAYGILLNGTISAENNQIKNVADPTDAQDVTTKSYVDNSVLNTYTQAEVDAIISSLQEQIDALQAATGSGTVTDQDGNSYPYLTYGDQAWTVKNADVVTYRDGTEIPQVTDATEWSNLTKGAWCYYDNDPNKGRLYNWYAVMGIHDTDPNTANKEFAPDGWHVPTDAEWTKLEEYLIASGYNYDGTTTENKIAKSMASTTGWNSSTTAGAPGNDQSSNNSSGFNAFAEGLRSGNGSFLNEGGSAIFWSSSESSASGAWGRDLYYSYSGLGRGNVSKQDGFSVRFVKDN